jgi:Bacterial SH3 domain
VVPVKRALVLATLLVATAAHADAFLRVIGQKASVRSGPGINYREVAIADRGQVFQVLERGSRDYWFKIELDDGTSGWILGDLVFPFEVGEEGEAGAFTRMGRAIRAAILGPSPVPYATVGISFSAGILQNEGIFMLRPSWLIDSYWARV